MTINTKAKANMVIPNILVLYWPGYHPQIDRKNFKNRHSKSFDRLQYEDPNEDEIYSYKQINKNTGLLTVNSFDIGENEEATETESSAELPIEIQDTPPEMVKISRYHSICQTKEQF